MPNSEDGFTFGDFTAEEWEKYFSNSAAQIGNIPPVEFLFDVDYSDHEERGDDFNGTEKAVDIAFVISASGAQASSVFARMVAILKNFANEYEISDDKTRVSLVAYNGPAIARVFFNDGYSKANFTSFMSSIPGPGGQSGTLSGAFTKVRDEVFTTQNGERLSAENILVVLTPGNFDENSTEIQNEITNFRSSAVVIVFAITEEPGIDKWEKISSGINLIVIPEPSKDTEEAKKLLHAVNKVKEI